jgi:hypothetical protein
VSEPGKSDTGMHDAIDTAEGPALSNPRATPPSQNTTRTDENPVAPPTR